MATILITSGVPAEGFSSLAAHELLMPPAGTAFSREELAALLPRADAVVACGPFGADLIARAPRLTVISNYGAGYDRVDVAAAAARGIPVCNIPDATSDATAELAIGLMLAVMRRIGEMNLRLRGENPEGLFRMGVAMGRTLRGKTLGVLGLGHIGAKVAIIGRALGMEVIGYSRRGADPALAQPVDMAELLRLSDVLSLHCPLTAETRGLLGRENIARMKRGSVLVNTSRGAVVDCDALADALTSGQLSGAGLDVYPDEPHIPPRLAAIPSAVLTPHVGTNTAETRREMAQACARQIADALSGRLPDHVVNGVQALPR